MKSVSHVYFYQVRAYDLNYINCKISKLCMDINHSLFTHSGLFIISQSTGATPVDQIREGMRVEVQDVLRRNQLWLARIVENVGGRLYLRYEGLDNSAHDFWLFYLHERLHPIGWGEARGYSYHPPQGVLQVNIMGSFKSRTTQFQYSLFFSFNSRFFFALISALKFEQVLLAIN